MWFGITFINIISNMQRRVFCLLILLAKIKGLFCILLLLLLFVSFGFLVAGFFPLILMEQPILYTYFLSQAWLGFLHMGTYQAAVLEGTFCVSIFLYFSRSVFHLSFSGLESQCAHCFFTLWDSILQPQSTLDIAIPQYGVKGRMIYYLSYWLKAFLFVWNS